MAKIPNNQRAVVSGKIVTYHNGRRIVRKYESGEPLDASTLRGKVLERLGDYRTGLTADDLSIIFDTPCSTIAARLRELELAGNVVKTKEKRLTRYKRKAFVYVHVHHWHPNMGRATVKPAENYDIIRLEAEHARMKTGLEAIREIYAGMEGFKPVTCPEGYLQKVIADIYEEVKKALPHSA